MALDTTTLKNALHDAFMANLTAGHHDQATDVTNMALAIATAITAFIETATITYTAGLVAPPGGGPVTGVFTNIIS